MLIKELYEKVSGLPTYLNVVDENDNHIWIGEYDRTPEEIKMRAFEEAIIRPLFDSQQITFYV